MSLEPFDWSVVINGSWNRAILTPAGITERLFKLKETTAIDVEVAINGIAPHRVSYGGLRVRVSNTQIIIDLAECRFELLSKAMEAGRNVLESLPETPLIAAGFNIKYKIDHVDSPLAKKILSPFNALSDLDLEIESSTLEKQLSFDSGSLNIKGQITEPTEMLLFLNFHLESTDRHELSKWLNQDCSILKRKVNDILRMLAGVTEGEISNE